MGAGVARSLLRDGHSVTVWNRTRDRAEPLAQAGARVADSAAGAMADAEVVVTTLFDADATVEVMAQSLPAAGLATGAVWLQSSTAGMDGVERCADVAREAGVAMIDAPMLGTKQPAEQGKLVMLLSGDRAATEQAQPVLLAMSSRTVWAGERIGQATALKLACNAWIATVVTGTAQSLALAEGLGVDPALFLQAVGGGAADSQYLQAKGRAMLEGSFEPSFTLDGVRKDLRLISEAAEAAGVSRAVLDAAAGVFAEASRAGHGAADMSAVWHAWRATPANPSPS